VVPCGSAELCFPVVGWTLFPCGLVDSGGPFLANLTLFTFGGLGLRPSYILVAGYICFLVLADLVIPL